MLRSMIEIMNLNRDDIDLWIMKTIGSILTIMAVLGYLDAVSKLEMLLIFHIIVVALFLLVIVQLGYSVFHARMMTDTLSEATLINTFSTVMATMNQVRATLMFVLITNELFLCVYSARIITLIEHFIVLLTLICFLNVLGVTCSLLLKQINPTLYLRVSQSWISVRIILAVDITASVGTILIIACKCGGHSTCTATLLRMCLMPVAFISTGILMKIGDRIYSIRKRITNLLERLFKLSVENNSTFVQVATFVSMYPIN